MRAKITKKGGYRCAPEGRIVVTFEEGTIVEGYVAEIALQDHAASRMFDQPEAKKVVAPKEVKKKADKK